ncbi:MAG: ACP S-malonyltransferase [Desulfohalobiaceae bacterium]|nr:ACP S-malonyltransferase [Desulfohalobiaceae bacterium]
MIDQATMTLLFPGQGSQEKGMGREMAEKDPEIMDLWKKAETVSGADLREIYWDGDTKAMTETRYQQPALTVVGLGLWSGLDSVIKPAYLAGHSVGEFVALAAAGVLQVREVLDLVALRGRLMFEAGREQAGKMAACLKLNQDVVQEIVNEVKEQTGRELCIANFNSPAQLVISGEKQAVDQALELIKQRKGRGLPLQVSGAFHSRLMLEPARELSAYMKRFSWREPRIPVHLNVTARPETSGDMILEKMQQQMTSPVLWMQLIQDQWDRGVRHWLELGPKGVLTGLAKHILQAKEYKAENISSLDEVMRLREEFSGP